MPRLDLSAPSAVALTDRFAVTLTVTGPAPLQVTPPDWDPAPAFRLCSRSIRAEPGAWSCRYELDPLMPGPQKLALPTLRARAGPGEWTELRPSAQTITVTTELPRADLALARPLRPPPEPPPSVIWWPAGSAIALALAVAVAWRLRKKRDPIARLSGAELDRYVRGRLARHFGLPPGSLTTPELTAVLSACADSDAWREWLETADRERFSPTTGMSDPSVARDRARELLRKFEEAKR